MCVCVYKSTKFGYEGGKGKEWRKLRRESESKSKYGEGYVLETVYLFFAWEGAFFVLVLKPGKKTKACKKVGVGILKCPHQIKGWDILGAVGELEGVK